MVRISGYRGKKTPDLTLFGSSIQNPQCEWIFANADLLYIDFPHALCFDISSHSQTSRFIWLFTIYGQMDSAKLIATASMKVVCDLLASAKNLTWAGAALAMVAYILRRIDKANQNNESCLTLFKSMRSLAKHIRVLLPELPEHDQKLRDATFLIARGVALCSTHWRRGPLSKYWSLADFCTTCFFCQP